VAAQGKREDESSETGSECDEKKRTENRAKVSVSADISLLIVT